LSSAVRLDYARLTLTVMETIEKLAQRGQQTPHGFKDIQNAADDVVASNTMKGWVG
jgi:hypothetical protein